MLTKSDAETTRLLAANHRANVSESSSIFIFDRFSDFIYSGQAAAILQGHSMAKVSASHRHKILAMLSQRRKNTEESKRKTRTKKETC
jgi:hypothetical protein